MFNRHRFRLWGLGLQAGVGATFSVEVFWNSSNIQLNLQFISNVLIRIKYEVDINNLR